MSYGNYDITLLLNQTCKEVSGSVGGGDITFTLENDEQYILYHDQNCCESVYVEDIIGDLSDLVGSPILMAEEISNADEPSDAKIEDKGDCEEWTFYKFATVKGYVTIRFYGDSNGYYSTGVDFAKIVNGYPKRWYN